MFIRNRSENQKRLSLHALREFAEKIGVIFKTTIRWSLEFPNT